MKWKWGIMTDNDKLEAIAEEMWLETHNGTTKDDFIEIMRFLYGKWGQEQKARQQVETELEQYKKALKLAAMDNFYVQKYKLGPPGTRAKCNKKCHECSPLSCWCDYFLSQAKEALHER